MEFREARSQSLGSTATRFNAGPFVDEGRFRGLGFRV